MRIKAIGTVVLTAGLLMAGPGNLSSDAYGAAKRRSRQLALKEGHYTGWLKTGKRRRVKMNLIFRSLDDVGRRGSFLGIILRKNYKSRVNKDLPKVAVYIVDPKGGGGYVLNPWGVNQNHGETTPVGTPLSESRSASEIQANDNPSLELNLTEARGVNRVAFSIRTTNSGNTAAFQGNIISNGWRNTKFRLARLQSGRYKLKGVSREAAVVSPIDQDTPFEAPVSVSAPGYWDVMNAEIREKIPGVYTAKGTRFLNTGPDRDKIPQRMGVFLQNRIGRTYFVAINPLNFSDALFMKRRF